MASGAEGGPEQSASPEAANINQLQQSGLSEGTADDQCPICLVEISSPAYASNCFHTFCFDCIWQWACTNPVCPLCRKPFDGILRILKVDATRENVVGFHISQQMPGNSEEVGSRSSLQEQQQQLQEQQLQEQQQRQEQQQLQMSPRSSTDDPTEESMESEMGDEESEPEAAPEASSQQGAGENPDGSGEGNVVHNNLQEGLNFMEIE